MERIHFRISLAAVAALTLVGAFFVAAGPADASASTQIQTARDLLANCQLLAANSTGNQRQRARDCVTDQTRILALLTGSTPTPVPSTSAPSPSPSTVPPTTAPPVTPSPTVSPTQPPSVEFPNAGNTGVPNGTTLTTWTGSCVITTAQTITNREFNCNVTVRANVSFVNVRVNGFVSNDGASGSVSLTNSEVALPGVQELRAVIGHDLTLRGVEVTGGNGGVWCLADCDIRDSWIHGQKIQGTWHASAVRMEHGLTLIHNTLVCDAPVQPNPEGSCSASLTGYGDYAPVENNLIQGNFFAATQYAAYCAYGGSSQGKPYSNQANNIRFIDNVFERGSLSTNRNCALYGARGDWDGTRPGNVWSGNKYSDGTVIS